MASLRLDCRSIRPNARADGEHHALFGLHRRVRASRTTFGQLVVFRVGLGLGMGGEWASGAALVSETWPRRTSRQSARASCRAPGRLATRSRPLVNSSCSRAMDGARCSSSASSRRCLTLWVRRTRRRAGDLAARAGARAPPASALGDALFERPAAPLTIALTLMNACTLFGWWGFNLWLPSYLQQPAVPGRRRPADAVELDHDSVVMQLGMWLGYVTFGFISDRIRTQAAPTWPTCFSRRSLLFAVRVDRGRRSCCSRSARSSRFSRPATSAASAP